MVFWWRQLFQAEKGRFYVKCIISAICIPGYVFSFYKSSGRKVRVNCWGVRGASSPSQVRQNISRKFMTLVNANNRPLEMVLILSMSFSRLRLSFSRDFISQQRPAGNFLTFLLFFSRTFFSMEVFLNFSKKISPYVFQKIFLLFIFSFTGKTSFSFFSF